MKYSIVLVTDNDIENVNKVMKETLEGLNIHYVTTAFYHPQSNSKVEWLHRIMHNILSKKKIRNNDRLWDLYINQMLAAIKFNISKATKFSLYYFIIRTSFCRDIS